MALTDGYTKIGSGKIASVVTYLEMSHPPDGPEVTGKPEWSLEWQENPDPEWYRRLFRLVGQDWLWFSRLELDLEALALIIRDPRVEVFALKIGGIDKGLLEIDRREVPDVELAFIGLTPDAIGIGAGKFLLDQAVRLAWTPQPRRVLVHTCTLDHPRALPLYCSAGFVPYARAIEVADDPRLTGILPRTAAANVPVI